MTEVDTLRHALSRIASVASSAINGGEFVSDEADDDTTAVAVPADAPACVPKTLPDRLLAKAAALAAHLNPANAPFFGANQAAFALTLDPMQLAVLTAKYWGPQPRKFTVSFMESTPSDVRTRIISHMNAWNKKIGMSFTETGGTGEVRISRAGAGYWSYVGTDVLLIPKNRPTMNLQGFSMNTPESEYKRVVRHETGHTLGFPHEHMRKALIDRIDPKKAYDYFLRNFGWDKKMVDSQVLTPLEEKSLMGTSVDQTSIMCYQLPGTITRDGKPITGGTDINTTDYAFAAKIYPKAAAAGAPAKGHDLSFSQAGDDWPESEDPDLGV
jgi:hypothetical protein